MRWWGLYTQRAPGIDGGRTAVLEPEELEDKYFMLRIRIDGGQLTTEALRTIGQVSTQYARDTADLTDRQNVQLHWVRIEDVPGHLGGRRGRRAAAPRRPAATCRGSSSDRPLAGIAADEIIDGTPAIQEIIERYIGSEEFSNLPRKFKTAISGSPRQDVAHEIHDIAFVGCGASRARPRIRPLGRRRTVHQPDARPAARRLGAAGRGRRTSGRASCRSSATTATAGCATGPG